DMINALPQEIRGRVRRAEYVPSLAYRLAMVADGSLDASFVKPNSHDWDLAAADLILREAGGGLLDEHGKAPTYGGAEIRHGALAGGSGELLAVMARTIGAAG
ncbi:MAG TPA: inositol monophosphatase family protein, partial [Rhizobiaceae bacterium]